MEQVSASHGKAHAVTHPVQRAAHLMRPNPSLETGLTAAMCLQWPVAQLEHWAS